MKKSLEPFTRQHIQDMLEPGPLKRQASRKGGGGRKISDWENNARYSWRNHGPV